jgi:ribosomal protein L40E
MRGYISAGGSTEGRVPLESETAIYRDPGDSEQVLAQIGDQTRSLGVADVTVSRKKDDTAPIVISPQSEFIEIRNNGNTNGVTVVEQGDKRSVATGHVENVTRDASIEIGYQTELQLTISRESKIEQNIVHEGDGDVVMGDSIDESTSVGDDNIINRSDIGGSASAAEVGDDNSINRSNLDEEEHDHRADDTHPTTSPRPSETDQSHSSASEGRPSGGERDRQFCMNCGTELTPQAVYCRSCGRNVENDRDQSRETAGDTKNYCERHEQTYAGPVCPECDSSTTR